MSQVAFAYDVPLPASRRRSAEPVAEIAESPFEQSRLALSLSIFSDRPHLRAELAEDAAAAGLRISATEEVAALLDGQARPLGDLVLVDCPQVDGAELAALSRLDMRAARCGAQLVVSTTVTALDDVFGCMDQSHPLILVDPTRAERVVALGEALSRVPGSRVRELSEEDRLAVLRLTEQVGQIARRLERLAPAAFAPAPGASGNVLPFDPAGERVRATQPAFRSEPAAIMRTLPDSRLPDPRLVRRIIRQRQLRGRFLDPELFADPAWDMLLDLTAAAGEKVRVSVSSLCIAAAVPPTTALRWIRQMIETGLLARIEDRQDRRRAFIVLTERARTAMAGYFSEIGEGLPLAV